MKRRASVVLALAVVVAAALASTAVAGKSAATKSQALSCSNTLKLAIMTPLTGDAGFIGQEQLYWARYAVKTLPAKYGLKIKLLEGDTQLSAELASSLAQKYVADKSVVGIIGRCSKPASRMSRRRRPA
jgi:ABC-type branched-subunit amino acid transport system substrate-binding protein